VNKEYRWFWSVMALGFALRLHGLGTLALDQDELYTLRDATRFWSSFSIKPVYYFLQNLLLHVFPADPLYLRLPAITFGMLGMGAMWWLARSRFGLVAAWVSTLLLALSGWHLYASQFARYWSLIFLLTCLGIALLQEAIETDRRSRYLATLLVIAIGTLTHPTFPFPFVGIVVAVHMVGMDGRVRVRGPSRTAWRFLWGPLIGMGAVGFVGLLVTGRLHGVLNGSGRGMDATLRLLPAIVQWMGVMTAAAAAVGGIYLLSERRQRDRQWAAMAGLGAVSILALLTIASLVTDVYADYAIGILPLVYITVGGAVQRLSELERSGSWGLAAAATGILAIGGLPLTLSHLSDGTRFDFRPAYHRILVAGRSHLVIGGPRAMQIRYAPGLQFEETPSDSSVLSEVLSASSGFWFVGRERRFGLVDGQDEMTAWLERNCREVLRTERPRLDYRVYRVVLRWCAGSRH